MNREKQIEEMAEIIDNTIYQYSSNPYPPQKTMSQCIASDLVYRNYRKMDEVTLKLDLGDRTPEEIKQIAGIFNGEIKKQVAKEIIQRVVNICKNEEDFQDGTTNTQLEPLYLGIANGCAYVRGEVKELAKDYGVEVDK